MNLIYRVGKMKKSFTALLCLAIVNPSSILGQSNPGYLGKTQVLEVNVLTEWGRVISMNPTVVYSYGLSYEMARNKNFGVQVGMRSSNQKRYATGYEPSFYDMEVEAYLQPREANYPAVRDNDYLSYTNNELYVQFKRYNTSKGALAPYGSYWGVEFSGAKLTSKENRLRYQIYQFPVGMVDYPIEQSTNESVYAFIPSVIIGNRQMLTDELSMNIVMGLGTVLFHSSTNMTIYDEYADSPKEIMHYMMLRPVAASRIISVGFSLGYLF